MRAHPILLAVVAATTLIACDGGSDSTGPRTGFVLQPEEIPGESEILNFEDERQGDPRRLRSFLANNDPKVRQRAALAVGRLRETSLATDLVALTKDRDAGVRSTALLALSALPDPELTAVVEQAFGDESAAVRQTALIARGRIGGEAVPAALLPFLEGGGEEPSASILLGEAILAAVAFGDGSIAPYLVVHLGHPNPEVRWRAAYGLYRLQAEGAALTPLVGDADPRVRAFAALGLGVTGRREASPALIARLEDADITVAAAAAEALGRLGDGESALAGLLDSPVPRLRQAGIDALVESGKGARLRGFLNDPNPYLRAAAIDGLRKGGGQLSEFRAAAQDAEWRVRAAAARALSARGATDTLAKDMPYDRDARVVPVVLESLAGARYPELETLIAKHLEDKDAVVRARAARLVLGRNISSAIDRLALSFEISKADEMIDGKLAIVETLAKLTGDSPNRLNPIKQAALQQDWVLKNRAYALLQELGQTSGISAPNRVGTLRTASYYRDLVARGDFDYRATFTTDKGTIVYRLYPKTAQLHVAFLEEVAVSGYYVDQPLSAARPAWDLIGGDDRGDGAGRYHGWVRDELTEQGFTGQQLSLLRPFGRDSGCSQFRMSLLPQPQLDGEEIPIGELMSGAEVLDQLVPGDQIRDVRITSHEFRGTFVQQRVRIERPVDEPATTAPTATADAPTEPLVAGTFHRSSGILYLSIVALVMLVAALLSTLSTAKREDIPSGLWLVFGFVLFILVGYLVMIFTGAYWGILTSEQAGARILGKPNPPVMSDELAYQVCLGVASYIVLQLTLLLFLTSGRAFGRWLFVFLSLVEIALLATQLSTHLMIMYIIANVGILLNAGKLWLLLMDKGIRQFYATEDD